MKRDLRMLLQETGEKTKEHLLSPGGVKMLPRSLGGHFALSSSSLKKLWQLVTGKRKLSLAAKNRLALFAGFQSWDDLDKALHGDADASVNYK